MDNAQINKYINDQIDWKRNILMSLRKVIHEADPEITEEWKWDVPVFTHNGMVCAISAFKNHVKINFFKGANLKDEHHLINAGLESKAHRSIDFQDGDKVKVAELKDLIQEAVALNNK